MINYPKHIVCVGALVRNNEDKVLLVKTQWRGWELPGGQVEEGEDLLAAIAREIKEEAGVNIKIDNVAGIYSSLDDPSKLIIDFTAKYESGELTADNKETTDATWFTPDEAMASVSTEPTQYRLERLLSKPTNTRYASYKKSPFEVTADFELK